MKTVRWLAIAFLTSFAAILVVSSASGQRLEHDSSSVIFDYEVTNDYGIRFADEYERLGGVHTLGYPASYRFRLDDGFVYQVTQGALLQWRPEVKSAYLANTFEMLEHAGFDQWLLDTKGIPLPIKDDGSDGDWGVAKEIRLAWLTNDQIKARFLANPNPEVIASWSENRAIELYGLPMSYPEKHGPFISQRFQRVALQLWVEEVAGMPAVGTVVRVLGGDLLKEACLIPSYALSPKERMSCASGSYVAQHSASQSASDHGLERESSTVIFDYEVTNDRGILFADEYERLGGAHTLGYPASYRFRLDDGFVYQVTQGALLQWRPEVQRAWLANTFEMLEHAGLDQWLLHTKGVPLPIVDDDSDGDWERAKEIRLAWLTNDKIKARFFANPNPSEITSWSEDRAIELYGLPMSYPEKARSLHHPAVSTSGFPAVGGGSGRDAGAWDGGAGVGRRSAQGGLPDTVARAGAGGPNIVRFGSVRIAKLRVPKVDGSPNYLGIFTAGAIFGYFEFAAAVFESAAATAAAAVFGSTAVTTEARLTAATVRPAAATNSAGGAGPAAHA